MAILPKRKERDPNDPVQKLRTKHHGEVLVDGISFMGGPGVGIHIIKTPAGGYRKARGGPIKSETEICTAIPPGPEREKALTWFRNKDKWQESAPRKIGFQAGTGYPIFEDTGEFVETEEDLMAYWPAGDILWAAIRSLNKRRDAKVENPEPRVTYDVAAGAKGHAPERVAEPEKAETPPSTKAKGGAPKGKTLTRAQLQSRREKLAANKAAKEEAAAAAQ